MNKILGSVLATFGWMVIGGVCSADTSLLQSTATLLAEWKEGSKSAESIWAEFKNKCNGRGKLEVNQAVVLYAGEVFGDLKSKNQPERFKMDTRDMCEEMGRESEWHTLSSSILLFELRELVSGDSKNQELTNKYLIEHTPLAGMIPLCRGDGPMSFGLRQAAIQHEVYRRLTTGERMPAAIVVSDNSMSFVDQTLLMLANNTPNQLIYSVPRSTLDKLFNSLFSSPSRWSFPYFTFSGSEKIASLSVDGGLTINSKELYRGLGRALALSIVLGVPLGNVKFSEYFRNAISKSIRSQFDLEQEMHGGFYDILSEDIVTPYSGLALQTMWFGSTGRVLKKDELKSLIRFAEGSSSRSVITFMGQLKDNLDLQTQLMRAALGVSHLTAGWLDAEYPRITVTFKGKWSIRKVFAIQSGDETHHTVDLK